MPAALGQHQQRVIDLLERAGGSLCVEVVIRALAGVPADRNRLLRAITRLAAANLVAVTGKPWERRLGGAIVRLNPSIVPSEIAAGKYSSRPARSP